MKKILEQNKNKKLSLNVWQKRRNPLHMSWTFYRCKARLTPKELARRIWENSSGVVEIQKSRIFWTSQAGGKYFLLARISSNSDVLLFFYIQYLHYIVHYTILLNSIIIIWYYVLLYCYIATSIILLYINNNNAKEFCQAI